MIEVTTIRKEQLEARSDEIYNELFKMQGKRFNINIRANSYDFQSSARIEIWDDTNNKWNFVSSIPYKSMFSYRTYYAFKKSRSEEALETFNNRCREIFGYGFNYHQCAFRLDRDRLIEDAKFIVFNK